MRGSKGKHEWSSKRKVNEMEAGFGGVGGTHSTGCGICAALTVTSCWKRLALWLSVMLKHDYRHVCVLSAIIIKRPHLLPAVTASDPAAACRWSRRPGVMSSV